MPDAISQALAGKTITSVGSVFDDYFGQVDSLVLIIRTEAATYLDINPWKLVLLTLAVAIYGLAGLSAAIGFAITRSEEHTSELQSLMRNSYAVLCLKKKKQ